VRPVWWLGTALDRAGALAARLARRRPRWTVAVATAVICLVAIAWVDRPLALWLKADLDRDTFGFFKTITDVGLGVWWYVVIVAAWVRCRLGAAAALTVDGHAAWMLRARSWVFVLAVQASSGILITLLKQGFGRLRPRELFEHGAYGFAPLSGANAFPSGHSQVIWAMAAALWFVYPRYRAAYVVVALLIAASRVATTVHFLADALAGSVIAVLVALAWKDWFERGGRPPVRLP